MPANRFKRLLFWASGTDYNYISKCPLSEHSKYECFGALIILTSTIAGISMFLALSSTWTGKDDAKFSPILLFIPCSIIWASFIFWIDRSIISGMRRHHGSFRYYLQAVPRLALAALIGIVIAHPIELKVFESEIEKYLTDRKTVKYRLYDIRAEEEQKQYRLHALAPHEGHIKTLEQTIAAINGEISDTEDSNKRLRGTYMEARQEADNEDKVGSGNRPPGRGPVWEQKDADAKELKRQLDSAESKQHELHDKRSSLSKELTDLQKRVDEAVKKGHDLYGDPIEDVEEDKKAFASFGFLDRSIALFSMVNEYDFGMKGMEAAKAAPFDSAGVSLITADNVKQDNSSISVEARLVVKRVMIAITILFIIIEMTPVLVKLISPSGPYDVFLAKEVMSTEVQHLFEMAALAKTHGKFWSTFEDAHDHAYNQLFGRFKSDFNDVAEGRAAPLYRTLWEDLVARVNRHFDKPKSDIPTIDTAASEPLREPVNKNVGITVSQRRQGNPVYLHAVGLMVLTFFSLPVITVVILRIGLALDQAMEIAVPLITLFVTIILSVKPTRQPDVE